MQGDAQVQVEFRNSNGESFGQGKKVPMSFKDFLQHMDKGDQLLYMSTQEVGPTRTSTRATSAWNLVL